MSTYSITPSNLTQSLPNSVGQVTGSSATRTGDVEAAPGDIKRNKKSGWARWRAWKARKAAQAKTTRLQVSDETTAKKDQNSTTIAKQQKIKAVKSRKIEEARLKKEKAVEAARTKRAERVESIKARGGYRVHSDDELRPYARYPHIYGERTFQKPVDKPQSLDFLDLPLEIREMIYGFALELDEPIELWPDTGDMNADYSRRVLNGRKLRKLFRTKGEHNLGLLRTNKQVNLEAAEIFYGNNEFRFSGLNGHMVAYAYAMKIGLRNLNFIQSITIAMPFLSEERGHRAVNWNPTNWRRIHELYDRMPFPYPWTLCQHRARFPRLDFEHSWFKLAWMLADVHRLKKIVFVLPEYVEYRTWCYRNRNRLNSYEWGFVSALDDIIAAKPFLRIHVVRMFEDPDNISRPPTQRKIVKSLKSVGFCHVHLAIFSRTGNWTLAPRRYVDKHGEFVEDEALDVNEDETEMLPDIGRMFKRAVQE